MSECERLDILPLQTVHFTVCHNVDGNNNDRVTLKSNTRAELGMQNTVYSTLTPVWPIPVPSIPGSPACVENENCFYHHKR